MVVEISNFVPLYLSENFTPLQDPGTAGMCVCVCVCVYVALKQQTSQRIACSFGKVKSRIQHTACVTLVKAQSITLYTSGVSLEEEASRSVCVSSDVLLSVSCRVIRDAAAGVEHL